MIATENLLQFRAVARTDVNLVLATVAQNRQFARLSDAAFRERQSARTAAAHACPCGSIVESTNILNHKLNELKCNSVLNKRGVTHKKYVKSIIVLRVLSVRVFEIGCYKLRKRLCIELKRLLTKCISFLYACVCICVFVRVNICVCVWLQKCHYLPNSLLT